MTACSDSNSVQRATVIKVELVKIAKFVHCDQTLQELKAEVDHNNDLIVYKTPDNILVLPLLQAISHECQSGYIHIELNKNLKSPIKKCSLKPRYHYLVKTQLMCIHVLICKLVRNENKLQPLQGAKNAADTHPSSSQFSKIKTTENVVDQILASVPSPLKSESEKLFLQKSVAIQQELLNSQNLTKYDETSCKQCKSRNILRNRKSESGFIVTPGFMLEVQINTFVCKTCDIVLYPNMYDVGFVPISEKLIVSWSYMIDARNQVLNGVKLYNYFKSSLRRLCIENVKLSLKLHRIDFHNLAVGLAKCTVAYNSACLLKSCNDMDTLSALLCLHCGIIPITLMSDGNAKNSIFLRGGCDNLYFDKSDESEIPSLDEFLRKCVISVAGSSLFQLYPKEKINVYKIPPIIGQRLISDLKNREQLKKSVFLQELDLSSVNFNGLEEMVTSGEFDLLKSRSLNLKTIRKLAKKLKIPKCSKQSKVMLENIILELFEWLIGGNSNCHKYCHSIGETGGWTDQWCVHNIKYGSKIMILQDGVKSEF